MDEPFLEPRKISNFQFGPALSQIPEEDKVSSGGNTTGTPRPLPRPNEIKERLIYGYSESSLTSQSSLSNRGSPSYQQAAESGDLPAANYDTECTCTITPKDIADPSPKATAANKPFDDSFLDNHALNSYRHPSSIASLTRLDLLRDAAVGFISPALRLLPASNMVDYGERDSAGASAALLGDETEKQFHSVLIPPLNGRKGAECHACSKKQLPRSRTAPALAGIGEKRQKRFGLSSPTPSNSSFSVVSQACVGLVIYLAVGVALYTWKQDEFSGSTTHGFIDAVYFCIVTMCTIGYGDIIPTTPLAKLFSCAFVLIGFGFIDILLSGMVSFLLDRQEAVLLSAVAAGRHETATNYLVDVKKGRLRIRSKVAFAFGVVIMCIGVGTLFMHFIESLGWLDSFYLSCMSVTTVGYGDHAFKTSSGRLFAAVWLLVSTLAVARSFLYLAEARIDKRHRLIAKLVLEKEMTVGDLLAADLDNDGRVSKSDFVVYKLKEMGKIQEKHILEICKQFSRLDTDNCGKITLSCLINLHETSALKQKDLM